MITWLIYLLLSAGSLALIARFLPGFQLRNFGHAVLAAFVYGVLQTLLSGILSVIAFVPIMLTFGLFIFVINAFILFLTDKLLEGFEIQNLTTTLIGAVALTVLNGFWRFLLY
ncbi:MAG: phage holin family protein [Candidatus Tectomicrobia bacterium]|nr:phage holin family protein [Candidatus Tectomicrobia bacterium]